MSRYRLTASAAQDVDRAYAYIATENLPAAGHMLRRFSQAFQKLASMPGMGHLREDLSDQPLRFWAVGPYLIIYRPETDPLEIVRVVHASRDLASLLDAEKPIE